MSNDLKLSPETAALAALAGSVINAALDKGLEGDPEGFDAEVDAAMAVARPAFPDEEAARRTEMLALTKQAMRNFAETRKAREEGRTADIARLDAELAVGQARVGELTGYQGFTTAAERLHRAKSLDDFLAALPEVDLGQIYGNAYRKISPFPLIWAIEARERSLERVQAMLNAGAQLDLTTKYPNFTVLHWIAQSRRKGRDKRLAILRLLVLKGADLEAKDWHGRTPLHLAITHGSVDEVAIFLAAGADARAIFVGRAPRPLDRAGLTTLMLAAEEPEKMQLLLEHGADPAQRGADGWDLLAHLRKELAQAEQWLMETPEKKRAGSTFEKLRDARAASLALVKPLLGTRPADPARKLTYREAPELFHALQTDLPLDDYRATLGRVDITTYHAPNGDHPIYWPIRAKTDRPQKLWLMLKAGASVQGDPGNGTALHILATQRLKSADEQSAMVRMLVQAGADIAARDYGRMTPLVRAVECGGLAEMKALLAAGVSVRASGSRTGRLLRKAACKPKVFRLLLDSGACPDVGTAGWTGLNNWFRTEISRLDADLQRDVSGKLRRAWDRDLRGYRACEALLAAKAGASHAVERVMLAGKVVSG